MKTTPNELTDAAAEHREIKPGDFVFFRRGDKKQCGQVMEVFDEELMVAVQTHFVSLEDIVEHQPLDSTGCPRCGDWGPPLVKTGRGKICGRCADEFAPREATLSRLRKMLGDDS